MRKALDRVDIERLLYKARFEVLKNFLILNFPALSVNVN